MWLETKVWSVLPALYRWIWLGRAADYLTLNCNYLKSPRPCWHDYTGSALCISEKLPCHADQAATGYKS